MKRHELLAKRRSVRFDRRQCSEMHRSQSRGPARMLEWKGEDQLLRTWVRGVSYEATDRFLAAAYRGTRNWPWAAHWTQSTWHIFDEESAPAEFRDVVWP